jgi:Tfp pilus assembly protein PilF
VALQSRGHSIGPFFRLCCLLARLILALCGTPTSLSQEKRAQNADLSSGAELERGIALAQKGDFKKAEEAFEQAVTLHPHDPRALTALGRVQEQLGKLPESIETFHKVIKLDPRSPEAHENLGIALGRSDRPRRCTQREFDRNSLSAKFGKRTFSARSPLKRSRFARGSASLGRRWKSILTMPKPYITGPHWKAMKATR